MVSGTYLEVTSPQRSAGKIVYQEFKRLDKIFNLYKVSSELTRLNSTFNQPVKVSAELIEVLNIAKQVYDLSDGAFDVSQGALYKFWKEKTTKGKIEKFPSKNEIEALKQLGGMNYLVIDSKEKTLTIKRQGLIIDLGAIAKGYMVDKAAMKLRKEGINSAIINAGGDIYCLGKNKNQAWRVGIKNPEELRGLLETQELINEAVATSGNYEQFFEFKDKQYSHLIDPRSGYPVDNQVSSVSVITKNCTSADSLATAFFVIGKQALNKYLAKNLSTMRIFMVTEDAQGKNIHMFR